MVRCDVSLRLADIYEEVARMRVSVEEAVLKDLLQVGLKEPLGDRGAIDSSGGDGVIVSDLDCKDIFQGQHPPGGIVPVDPGDVEVRLPGKVGPEAVSVAPLAAVIQFGP